MSPDLRSQIGSSYDSDDGDLEKKSKKKSLFVWIPAIVLVLGLLGFGGYYFYNQINHPNQLIKENNLKVYQIPSTKISIGIPENISSNPKVDTDARYPNQVLYTFGKTDDGQGNYVQIESLTSNDDFLNSLKKSSSEFTVSESEKDINGFRTYLWENKLDILNHENSVSQNYLIKGKNGLDLWISFFIPDNNSDKRKLDDAIIGTLQNY